MNSSTVSTLSNSVTSLTLVRSEFKRKVESKQESEIKFDLENMFGQIRVLDDLIISYFSAKLGSFASNLENAKNYLCLSHWTKRDDLRLVSLFLLQTAGEEDPKRITKEVMPQGFLIHSEISRLATQVNLISSLKFNGCILKYGDELIRHHRLIVHDAVRRDGAAIQYIHPNLIAIMELSRNYEIFLDALRQDGMALYHLNNEFKDYPLFVLTAVEQNGLALKFASDRMKSNERVVKAAVLQNGCALEYASEALRNNPDIVLAAVQQNGLALKFASLALRANPEIIQEAINQNFHAIQFVA